MPRAINKGRVCSIDGCQSAAHLKGYCRTHYDRWLRHGDPETCLTTPRFAAQRFLNQAATHKGDECLLWPFRRDRFGYGAVRHQGHKTVAHRVICEEAHGPQPSAGHEVAHTCGNGHLGCVNPCHLRRATRSENQMDRALHGTSNRGERAARSKLTLDDVKRIRASNERPSSLADDLGVSPKTITAIRRREIWAWVPEGNHVNG
jgi:hypothetical protein